MQRHLRATTGAPIRPLLASLFLATAGAAQAQQHAYVNVTAGGPLRAGVYGRIEVRNAPPPPLLSPQPVVASKALGPPQHAPVYLYVPAGQVRKWSTHCRRYDACDRPVYFVRMDDAPFRLGSWKQRSKASGGDATTRLASSAGSPF